MAFKVGRNETCPCGSGEKFKRCCSGVVDWEEIIRRKPLEAPSYLTVRGRNLAFLRAVASALQLRRDDSFSWADVKRAMSPAAVREIHEAILLLWPSSTKCEVALRPRQEGRIAGLYVGMYEPEQVLATVERHSLYADKILLFDPLTYPHGLNPEYNPIQNPSEFVVDTMKHLRTWLYLAPWIHEGDVPPELVPGVVSKSGLGTLSDFLLV